MLSNIGEIISTVMRLNSVASHYFYTSSKDPEKERELMYRNCQYLHKEHHYELGSPNPMIIIVAYANTCSLLTNCPSIDFS